jgi:alkylation response protein AidB-like acyl-CoA dehydrogenase
MNFDFSPREKALFQKVHDIMRALEQDRNLESPDQNESAALVRNALARLGASGYLNLGLTEDPDGSNETLTLMGAMEALSVVSPSIFLAVEMSSRVFGRIVRSWGRPEQRERLLGPLRGGQILGAVALCEKAMNTENDPLGTTGRMENETVVINGRKTYVVNGPMADWFAVAGLIENQPVFFLVESRTPGLTTGSRLTTLGYEGTLIADVALDECRIPRDRIIGPLNEPDMLPTVRFWENQILIGGSLGLMQSAFERAKAFAHEHHSGGKPIIAYQEVAFKLAEMLTLLQTAQLLAYRTAWTADTDHREAQTLTLCTKVFCTETAERVASAALQIMAGTGFVSGNAAERAYRCAKYGQIAGTSTEIARVQIGDEALGWQ